MHYWSWYGNISNFRITKGLALYDGGGTNYTVPTFPLTTDAPSGATVECLTCGVSDNYEVDFDLPAPPAFSIQPSYDACLSKIVYGPDGLPLNISRWYTQILSDVFDDGDKEMMTIQTILIETIRLAFQTRS